MAMQRLFSWSSGARRAAILSSYDDNDPYMPGGDSRDDRDRYDDRYGDDGYYGEDGYDDGYDDDPYYGDDRYEGDDRYDEDGYPYEEDPYYDEGEPEGDEGDDYPRGPLGDALRFADENDWVTWALLVVLPPLGIWLLWRRQRYARNVNLALSVLSALWLVLAIVLLTHPFRPRTDTTITPQPVGGAATEAEAPEATPEPEAEATASGVLSNEEVDEANAVYVAKDLPYYHQQQTCSAIPEGGEITRVSRNTAIEHSLMACPYCLASQYSDGLCDLVFVDLETEDKSNIQVYCSAFNTHFHTDPSCSDLGTDAHLVGLKDALLMSKTACDICCPDAGRMVFCTKDDTYYHVKDECSGMRNASSVTYAEARVTGKKRCPHCIGGTDETETQPEEQAQAESADSTYYVWATPNGQYYHIDAACSGMQNAQQYPLSEMLSSKRPACPVCCADAEHTVYAEPGGQYFHSNSTCSGMTNPVQGILVNALAAGYQRCPICWATEAES